MVQMNETEKLKAFEQSLQSVRDGDRPVLEINGQRVTVISAEALAYFQALEDAEDLRQARVAMAEEGGIELEELARKLGL